MTREEAIKIIDCYDIGFYDLSGEKIPAGKLAEAFDMAIEALSANATVAKIQIDDIDKEKTSSQLLDGLAVDMVNAMGKRIVEVVRCRDCRYYWGNLSEDDTDEMYGECRWDNDEMPNADDFCSYGEMEANE